MIRPWQRLCLTLCVCLLSLTSCSDTYSVGDIYRKQGVVVAVDADGKPTMLLALDEQKDLDADSAQRWAATLDEGWILPNKEQLEQVRKQRILLNRTLEDKKLPTVMRGHAFYWSSTECSPSHVYACGPDGLKCYLRTNHSQMYFARAIYLFEDKADETQQ